MTRARIAGRFDLDRAIYDALVEHARSDFPFEVCGLLAGEAGQVVKHWRIPNDARSMTFYNMEPRAMLEVMRQIDEQRWELLGIYHSHTHTEAFPSPTDLELAFYPEAVYLIVSLQDPDRPVVRAFNIVDGEITERTLFVDGEQAPVGSR
ncbi:MAG TPA: M67 family metallopeptidase [Egibacteraceae bacterium]|nr:M67 family metallopeptidase [Actinomycetota bacterium]HWB70744.1 M67 family metallopeptidase [Egibacteraceae bacterium]